MVDNFSNVFANAVIEADDTAERIVINFWDSQRSDVKEFINMGESVTEPKADILSMMFMFFFSL